MILWSSVPPFVGKVDIKNLSRKNKTLDKQQRRHKARQVRKNKREEVLEMKRKVGTEHSPPHLIVRNHIIYYIFLSFKFAYICMPEVPFTIDVLIFKKV